MNTRNPMKEYGPSVCLIGQTRPALRGSVFAEKDAPGNLHR